MDIKYTQVINVPPLVLPACIWDGHWQDFRCHNGWAVRICLGGLGEGARAGGRWHNVCFSLYLTHAQTSIIQILTISCCSVVSVRHPLNVSGRKRDQLSKTGCQITPCPTGRSSRIASKAF